ncbi:pilus assembly PilX family protein [Rheinheimera metallidurans]|uniref:pilus assembly PilX family protein n=1 Tax=Rheinheimera metallidurans TaxID=2925781 RepID=UPI0030031D83
MHTSHFKQKGVALVVSLLLLVAITLLALSSIKRTTLQEKMTANLYDKQLTQQQVEAALLEAERRLNVLDPVALAFVFPIPAATQVDRWTLANPGAPNWQNASAINVGMANPASYIVEYMGDWPDPDFPDCDSATTPPRGCLSPTFRITARTQDDDGRAAVIMQTIWRR